LGVINKLVGILNAQLLFSGFMSAKKSAQKPPDRQVGHLENIWDPSPNYRYVILFQIFIPVSVPKYLENIWETSWKHLFITIWLFNIAMENHHF
jgi:hypothetical protein